MADLESRFGYLRDYVKGWNVNGVILQSVKYCDVHGYEVPGLKDYLASIGLPSTYLEHDYIEDQGSRIYRSYYLIDHTGE